ncbi:hypothetical protein [Salibacterium aidingense]|uniref:hypothetical protein n=1 Tax=Salibacterium aidingense TaxID=384933 RepID=UPI0003FC1429|nr:hypothetical protein [Salibacterium aidingense]
MDAFYNQVQEYLNMEEEIGFDEFRDYYQSVIHYLDNQQQAPEEQELWKSLFVVESIMSNAENRGQTTKNNTERKKYKKMQERTKLYAQHFTKMLHQLGYDQDQIEEHFNNMLEEGPNEKKA